MIRAGKASELIRLQVIERSAGEAFVDIDMAAIAADEPLSIDALASYLDAGRLWVATNKSDEPVAYVLADVVDNGAHIEQVSVHADYAGRKLGKALIDQVASWAQQQGYPILTLTTFLKVPWNAPYYVRCGFSILPNAEQGPDLAAIRAREKQAGLDRWPRVAMWREIDVE